MAVDGLAPYVARPLAAIVLTMQDKPFLVFPDVDFRFLRHFSIEKW